MSNVQDSLNLRLFGTARALDNIFRCSRLSVLHRQSVSEHSFHVAFLGFLAAADLKAAGIPFDELKLLKLCLLHDFEEGMTGDIVNPVKRHNKKMEEAYEYTVKAMFDDMINTECELTKTSMSVWNELAHLESENCLEKRILKLLDMMEFVISQYRELQLGNRTSEKQYDIAAHYTFRLFSDLEVNGIKLPSVWEIFRSVAPFETV